MKLGGRKGIKKASVLAGWGRRGLAHQVHPGKRALPSRRIQGHPLDSRPESGGIMESVGIQNLTSQVTADKGGAP